MTADRWRRIEELFHQALELPAEQRDAWLQEHCDDAEIRQEVAGMLAQDSSGETNLRASIAEAAETAVELAGTVEAGTRIGAYRVERLLGRGGMGAVYLARRADEQYDKRVAIKLLRVGVTGIEAHTLFLRERQILAQLDHPSVARLLDGGTLENGQPYLVLDYVEGQPLLEWCEQRHTPLRTRLAIFVKVCEGVAYAHQNLIVHRDLKPQNILVNTDGEPKLLDFGIAKLLTTDWTEQTQVPVGLMTPQYASPEQLTGAPITTATDVYSLGAILYELVSGERPYETEGLSMTELVRRIVELPVHPPKAKIPSDLKNIVLHCLDKEPARRYGSADQLAADLRRYLQGEAVLARGDSVLYRAGKFVRRHWVGVAASAAIVGSLALVAIQADRNAREQARLRAVSENRFQQVRQLANRFLFDFHDSIQYLPGSTPARRLVLKTALEYLDGLASDRPSDPKLLSELSTAYERVGDGQGNSYVPNIGDIEGADRSYHRAMELRQRVPVVTPQDLHDLVMIHLKFGDMYDMRGKTQQARAEYESALKLVTETRMTGRPITVATLRCHMRLGDLEEKSNHAAVALKHYESGRDCMLALIADKPDTRGRAELSLAYYKIGRMLSYTGDIPASIEARRKGIQQAAAASAEDPSNQVYRRYEFLNHLGLSDNLSTPRAGKLRNLDEAFVHMQKARVIIEGAAEADPTNLQAQIDVGVIWNYIGGWYEDKQQWPKAVEAFRHSVAITDALVAKNPASRQYRTHCANNHKRLGAALAEIPQLELSLKEIRWALGQYNALAAADPRDKDMRVAQLEAWRDIAEVLRLMGRPLEGIEPNRTAIRMLKELIADDPTNKNWPDHLSPIYQQLAKCHAEAIPKISAPGDQMTHWRAALENWKLAASSGGPEATRPEIQKGVETAESALLKLR